MDAELQQISKELNRVAREIPKNVKLLDGWADRVMKVFHLDEFADYPKSTGRDNF